MRRRSFLASPLLLVGTRALAAVEYPVVRPGVVLEFPRDHGSHPEFRIEWWYVTGWTRASDGIERGLQITFFRNRTGIGEDNFSRFAPRQLLFAHAAVSDKSNGRLLTEQRAAREGFGLADAAAGNTDVHIDDWSLKAGDGGYAANIAARDFAFALRFMPTQPLMLEGEQGYSRKGPDSVQASYYYSIPQLSISGSMTLKNRKLQVKGRAWFDHEWSSEPLASDAVGWDWAGLNMKDGSALMVLRIRDRKGGALWSEGKLRDANGVEHSLADKDLRFEPLRHWRSPRSQADYPVAMRLRAGDRIYELEPLMDDQELDTRASTGAAYWEGAVRVRANGRAVGEGYLELTGYAKPLRY